MNELNDYIEQRNLYRALFQRTEIEFPLTEDDVHYLKDCLEGDLSPENLHCDGEISPAEAEKKYRYLNKVWNQLEAHDLWGVMYREPWV